MPGRLLLMLLLLLLACGDKRAEEGDAVKDASADVVADVPGDVVMDTSVTDAATDADVDAGVDDAILDADGMVADVAEEMPPDIDMGCPDAPAVQLVVDCSDSDPQCTASVQCTATRVGSNTDVTNSAHTTWSATKLAGAPCTATITPGGFLTASCNPYAFSPCLVYVKAQYDDGGTTPCDSMPYEAEFQVSFHP